MTIVNNSRIVKLSSQDVSSQDELEYFMCRKPLGNIRLYFDGKLLLDITNQDHPDYDEDTTKLMPSFS